MDYFMPTRLHAGEGCIMQHADELAKLGSSCLIVTDGQAARESGALADIGDALAAASVAANAWEGVTENPPVSACIEAGQLAVENGCDFVLGIGGWLFARCRQGHSGLRSQPRA